jgi:hypothetical protein
MLKQSIGLSVQKKIKIKISKFHKFLNNVILRRALLLEGTENEIQKLMLLVSQ